MELKVRAKAGMVDIGLWADRRCFTSLSLMAAVEGLDELLVACRLEACKAQGIKLGFITTTTAETIEILRDALSPVFDFGHFDLITTKADVAQEKPDGEVYRLAISHFGVPPHEVIAVEDTEVNQEAALKEELLCYLFAGEYATTRHNINALRSLNVIADSLRNQQ